MSRPPEERALLNPAFCSCLLWQAATGYENVANTPLPLDIAFLVLPIVLHRQTRESLPKTTTTALAVWLERNELQRSMVANQAKKLVPFTKEAIIFGGVYGLIDVKNGTIRSNDTWKKAINADLKDSTPEVRMCAGQAEFVGRWFAKAGSSATVMTILGVKP
jgi:hypothetical protein